MTAALDYVGVRKAFGRTPALAGLDLKVPRGAILGLVGSNGAGKTTAMAVAVGLLKIDAGRIDLLGQGAFEPSRHAGRVSVLPQDSRMPPHARVDELLAFYGRLQGIPSPLLARNVSEVLESVHLVDRRHAAVRTLSHGMARRLAIAQAFLGNPELVLLDEPLNGLDPREATRAREWIRGRRGRQTIVVSSHHLPDVEALCDTVAFIEHGRCVRQDSLDALVRRLHEVTFVLAGPTPPLEPLEQALPGVRWTWTPEAAKLTACFAPPLTTESVNRAACTALLSAGVGILEIRRGSDLEAEYLASSVPPLPLPSP